MSSGLHELRHTPLFLQFEINIFINSIKLSRAMGKFIHFYEISLTSKQTCVHLVAYQDPAVLRCLLQKDQKTGSWLSWY